ncbi:MAG: endolytic transglycosylase MltG [Alphaproteobacteria bacterium]|nr:endolytic transglycosylase MltG [Alphaproteobacteria bacterium]
MRLLFLVILIKRGIRPFIELISVFLMEVSLFFAIFFFKTYESFRQVIILPHEKVIFFERGASLKKISDALFQEGLIPSSLKFRVGVRLFHQGVVLQAGEYAFQGQVTPGYVMDQLHLGRVLRHKITLPEGWETPLLVKVLESKKALFSKDSIPPIAEGSLLPETYDFVRGESIEALITRMKKAQEKWLMPLWEARAPSLPLGSPKDALILASLVEKETAVARERPYVAAVFLNRLRKGMPLQCDATVRYGLWLKRGAPLSGALSKEDLKEETPFNTYVHAGLPPTAICHPGRAALQAVMTPAKTEDLYFVADGKGGHIFSTTYDQHKKHHGAWRKIYQSQKKAREALPKPPQSHERN